MAYPRFELPDRSKPEELVRVTNHLEATARARRMSLRVGWRHDLWWLKGVRSIRRDWQTGEVQVTHQTPRGDLRMRYEDVLVKRQREIGRLMQSDMRPSVKRKGIGLDAMRKASVGQVVLDHLASNIDIDAVKQRLFEDLVDFGTAGLGIWVQSSLHLGQSPVIEVIPPWELMPLPVEPSRTSDVYGIIRDRWVTLKWLESQEGLKIPKGEDRAKLRIQRLQPGHRLPGDAEPTNLALSREPAAGLGKPPEKTGPSDQDLTDWVYLREYWIEGEQNRLYRYFIKAGDAIVLDLDEEKLAEDGELPIMPVSVAQYYGTGFYGRAWVSPLIPINSRQERMVSNLFQNLIDLDLYGETWIPTTLGINKQKLMAAGRGKYQFYEPDYSAWQMRPFAITPQNMGLGPMKVVEFSHVMMDRLSRESDMYSGQAPGRIDNARSLGLLYETASIPLIPVTASVARAFSRIYGALLQEAKRILKQGEGENYQAIKLSGLDDATAGIVIDPSSGQMQLGSANPIPRPDEVIIDVRERMPRLSERRKMELDEALAAQRIDLVDYIIVCLKENVDVPLGNQSIVDSVRSAWLENMLIFGDGQTPGEVLYNQMSDNHKIHMRIHKDFMARPEWKLASQAVRDKFIIHVRSHERDLGIWQDLIPSPEVLSKLPPEVAQGLVMGAPQGMMAMQPGPGVGPPAAP